MTAHTDIAVNKALVALHLGVHRHDTLRQQCQRLRRLECRTRCLRLADSLTYISPMWCVRCQAQYLAILRVDGNNAARLTL